MSIQPKNKPLLKVKPILRWAGGKNWLTQTVVDIIGTNQFNTYFEPFLGGGSMYLTIQPQKAFLSDLNTELIRTYKTLKNNPEGIIQELKKFKNTEDFYYEIRESEIEQNTFNAAKFIFLNQTSFNGIYRVNANGRYNVPYGFRKKEFLDAENLKAVSKVLKRATITNNDFEEIKKTIKKKDLIFLDPPYTVSHNLNGFIKYNQKLFSLNDQYRLSTLIDYIKSKGAYYILTNAAHEKIFEIFDKKDTCISLTRGNLVGGLHAKRGVVEEYLFTNLL